MITAILDTNVIVQSLISSPPAAAPRVLDAYWDGRSECAAMRPERPLANRRIDLLVESGLRPTHDEEGIRPRPTDRWGR